MVFYLDFYVELLYHNSRYVIYKTHLVTMGLVSGINE